MDNNIFPLPFGIHLVFVCIAIVLFIVRFAREKRLYQALMGVAVALTLLLYMNTSKVWYNILGVIELVLIVSAFVSTIKDKKKIKTEKTEETVKEAE